MITTRKVLPLCLVLGLSMAAWAAEPGTTRKPAGASAAPLDAKHRKLAEEMIDRGVAYLVAQREDDGAWSMGRNINKPAITALVLKVLVQHPKYHIDSPVVRKGFEALLKFRQPDGGIYDPKMGVANYTTSVAVMAMAAAKDPRYQGALNAAIKYLRGLQITTGSRTPDGKEITKDHPFRDGVSYGKHGRPDLSNLGMWIQALREAGVAADDPAIQNALRFVLRCQERSESNPSAWAAEGANEGGFIYAPATRDDLTKGESKAGPGFGGRGLRSYGSMTYVGFMSLLYAGLAKDDPRVRAAYTWIRRYWRLDSNPNMPKIRSKEGLFYYYHAFAKALRAWGQPIITDIKGVEHNWRHELIDALRGHMSKDGSWVNAADRWHEGHPILVTCYAVLALQETLKK